MTSTDTAAASTDVDSSGRQQDDEQPATRRRVAQPSLGRGERVRSVELELGGYEYTVRCPKLVVWNDMAQIIAEQRGGGRSERRRAGDKAPADDVRVTVDRVRLTQAVQLFLRGCMSAADWSGVEGDLNEPDNDLDLPDLWAAGLKLIIEFKPDMMAMADEIGMKIPGVLDKLADRIGPDGQLEPEQAPAAEAAVKAPAKPRKRR
jgi:hypothetical protein